MRLGAMNRLSTKIMMKSLLHSVLCLGLVGGVGVAPGAEGLKPGDAAPSFALAGSDGKTHRLADVRGKQAVVIAWFPKAFTGGCTAECKSLRESGKELRHYDVAYFAASCDDAETNQKFAESLGLDFPILSDPSTETAKAYGVLIADKKVARRVTFYIGKDGKVLFVDEAVKPQTAGADAVARLKELGVAAKK
jgi:peroxiredoxin Q/BCP